jgi:hypothetical protein
VDASDLVGNGWACRTARGRGARVTRMMRDGVVLAAAHGPRAQSDPCAEGEQHSDRYRPPQANLAPASAPTLAEAGIQIGLPH